MLQCASSIIEGARGNPQIKIEVLRDAGVLVAQKLAKITGQLS